MRSAVQSCVPLQESTANRCVFFVYPGRPRPEGAWTLAFLSLKACFQSDGNDDGQPGSEATGGLTGSGTRIFTRILHQLSWVPCDRTERIRRSPSGDWNILRPATWKSSTYEIFASAFFLPVNTAWTPNLFISFNFHYFHHMLTRDKIIHLIQLNK